MAVGYVASGCRFGIPSARISPFLRYDPCPISEERRAGKPPGGKSRPVVAEAERRKNMGVVNTVSPPRGLLLPRNQIGVMGFSALSWPTLPPSLNRF